MIIFLFILKGFPKKENYWIVVIATEDFGIIILKS